MSTRVVPSESSLLQIPLVRLSGSVLCRTMGLQIICKHDAQTVELAVCGVPHPQKNIGIEE